MTRCSPAQTRPETLPETGLARPDLQARAAEAAAFCADRAAQTDEQGAFPEAEFERLRGLGLLTLPLLPEYGGAGWGMLPGTSGDLLRLLQTIGQGSLPVGRLYEGHVNALLLMQMFGNERQRQGWADDACRGLLFSVWNTQDSDGVRLVPLADGRYRLQGGKTFASGASHVARPLLTGALPDGGWQMVILPTERTRPAPCDSSFWQPLGMRATGSVRADFSGLEIGQSDLLGAPGDYYRQPAFGGGAIRYMAVQIGGARAVLEAVRAYLRDQDRDRDLFQRERTGRMAALVETGALWLDRAGALADTLDADTLVEYTHMARAVVEDACLEILRLAERSVGARGLLRPHPMERIHRDLTLYLRQAGADNALVSAGRHVLEAPLPASALWSR